jgi:hypothetical protein
LCPSSEDDVHGLYHRALLHKVTNNSPEGFSPVENAQKGILKDKNCNKISGIFREGSEA